MQIIVVILFFVLSVSELAFAQSPPSVPVTVSNITQKKVRKPVTLVGSVEPLRSSLVSAEVNGIVAEYPYSEGDYVEKGQVIATQNVNRLKIQLNEAINAKNESNARLRLAEDELTRIKELYDKGIVSKSQLDNAVSERDAQIARQKLFQSRINQLNYDISQTKIKSPFNGYITKEYTQIGEWLDSGDDVVELIDIDTVQIIVDMPERYIQLIKVGEKVNIKFNSLPSSDFKGEIVSIVPQADQASRAFPVKINLPNREHIIKASMSARVSFLLGDTVEVSLVPKDAVTDSGGTKTIFVVRDGAAHPVPVILGLEHENYVQVSGDIKVGEQVVVRGNERLRPMQPVEISSVIE